MKIFRSYGFFGIMRLLKDFLLTRLCFAKCRIIRFPIYIRGRRFISFNDGFTSGRFCRIEAHIKKDDGNIIYEEPIISFGKNVEINDYVHIAAIESVIIEDNVLIASRVFISDHDHGSYKGPDCDNPTLEPRGRKLHSEKVLIKKNAWIGEGVCILKGVTIGEGCIVGANSVVTRSVENFSIVAGIPAKVIKKFDLKNNVWCDV